MFLTTLYYYVNLWKSWYEKIFNVLVADIAEGLVLLWTGLLPLVFDFMIADAFVWFSVSIKRGHD